MLRAGATPPAPRARNRILAIWLAIVVVGVLVTARSHYVADLSAFLPSAPTGEQSILLDQVRSGSVARLVLIGITGSNAEARADASRRLAAALRTSGQFESVQNGDDAGLQGAGRFVFEHRYLLSPAVTPARFTVEGLRNAIDETVDLLGTPAGTMIKPVILRDPTGETVRIAEALMPAHAPRSEYGVWVSRSAPRAVLIATIRAEGADLDAQQHALEGIRASFAPDAAHGLTLQLSGAPVFGVAARAKIKSEVERLAIAGTVLVIVLLLVAFGSLRSLAIAALPVATGVVCGIAAVSIGFGRVHGVTLGFGTTLIGEAVDYAIYYLIQAHARPAGSSEPGGARHWLATSWPTVRLGLLTSLCGFAALTFSGFPGLAQLGVFSIAGLVAAALATRWVVPLLAPQGAPGGVLRRSLGELTRRLVAALPTLRWPLRALALGALVALFVLPSPWRGGLNGLSPISSSDLRLNSELRADVGAPDSGTLVAVAGDSESAVLSRSEAAAAVLGRLVDAGVLQGYESPTRLLPSPATQRARQSALPDASTLKTRLAEATAGGPLAADRLAGFVADVEAARREPLIDRTMVDATPLGAALDAQLVRGQGGRPWRAFLSLQSASDSVDVDRVRSALAGVAGVRVIQISAELGALYARYLREAAIQSLIGAAAVCALLALHLRSARRLAGVIEPIAEAVVIVLAAFAASGAALGILHLVGLLLVAAIGSNYALFFDHLHAEGRADVDTLASLALANLTTVLAFGLLASSSIPALYSIGQIVAPGALLCLLLSAALIGVGRTPQARGKMPRASR